MTIRSSHHKKHIQLETTPKVYHEYYYLKPPCYDLYPSLSRRLNNMHIQHQPIKSLEKQKQTNFITTNSITSSRNLYNQNEDPLWRPIPQPNTVPHMPSWDLYPSILRRVENFGTEQMRQRLHTMENTFTLH